MADAVRVVNTLSANPIWLEDPKRPYPMGLLYNATQDAFYFVAPESQTTFRPRKVTWGMSASAVGSAQSIVSFSHSSWQSAASGNGRIVTAYINTGTNISLSAFNTATETTESVLQVGTYDGAAGVRIGATGTDTMVVLYNGPTEKVHGTNYNRLYYRTYTVSTNTLGAETIVSGAFIQAGVQGNFSINMDGNVKYMRGNYTQDRASFTIIANGTNQDIYFDASVGTWQNWSTALAGFHLAHLYDTTELFFALSATSGNVSRWDGWGDTTLTNEAVANAVNNHDNLIHVDHATKEIFLTQASSTTNMRWKKRSSGGIWDTSWTNDSVTLTSATAIRTGNTNDAILIEKSGTKYLVRTVITDQATGRGLHLVRMSLATGPAPIDTTDNLGLTDSITTQRTVVQDTSNNLGLTDSITTELVAVRDVSDNLGLTDSALAERLLLRDYSDNLGLTDEKNRIEIAPSLDRQDSLDLTDARTWEADLDRSDNLGLTDALDPFAQAVDETDNLGLTDTGKRVDFIGDISNDAIGLTDSITAETFLGVDATDNLGLTDSAVFDVALDRQDDLDLTDATDPFGFTVNATDDLNLTDSFTVEIGFARDYTDTLGLTDTASDDSGEAHSDDLDLTDVATWQADLDRDDPLGLTDSISLELGEAVDASDTLGLTDSISFTQDFGPDVTDSLDLTDSDDRVWNATRDFSDNLGLTDSFTTEFSGAGTLDTSNNLGLSDSFTVEIGFTVDASDDLGLSDSFSLEIGYTLDLSDSLDLTDAAAFDSGVELDFSDNLGLTDSVAAVRSFGVSLSDDLGLTDTVETALTKPAVELVDTVALSDSISRVANYIRDFSDAVGLSDTRQYGWDLPNVDDPGRTSRTDRAGRTHDQGRLGSTTATNRRGMTATSNSKTYTHD